MITYKSNLYLFSQADRSLSTYLFCFIAIELQSYLSIQLYIYLAIRVSM